MTRNSGTLTPESRKKIKGRGKDRRTMILEGMRRACAYGALEEDSNDEVELKYWEWVVGSSINKDDPDSGMLAKVLIDKLAPSFKPCLEKLKFSLDTTSTPSEQTNQILSEMADGIIPPDVGNMIINSITNMIKIDEITILADKLDRLEKSLGGKDG
jgi:hypothetical protein